MRVTVNRNENANATLLDPIYGRNILIRCMIFQMTYKTLVMLS